MKKILAAALASVMLVGGAALAAADGELNICSPNSDGLLSIIPVFEEQTGIKVNVESIGTGDCMKRIESEIAQEYSTFDLMYGGSLANYVANAGLFQDYVSEQDQYLMDAYKNTRGYCTNYTIDGSVLLVNTDMLKELGVEVNGYADLLQPELVGKIASADPASSSSAFCQLTNMLLAMGGSPWVLGLGIGLFAVTTAFAFITLPVEFDASARALKWLDRSHLMNYFDHGRAKSALFWAAMTYVVGALSSLAMLLYYVFIFLNARGRE